MKNKKWRKQVAMLSVLSVLAFACLAVEAGRKGLQKEKASLPEKKGEQIKNREQGVDDAEGQGEEKPERKKEQAGGTAGQEEMESQAGQNGKKTAEGRTIRVLLKTQDFSSFFHEEIRITSAKPFAVTVNGKKKKYKAGKVVSYSCGKRHLKKKKIAITPQRGGKLKVLSFRRRDIHPSYRRTLKVIWRKEGLLLVNELPLEEYLYAVISSEMSTSEGIEALKAQAVCARSFAYLQIQSGYYKKYHADLDDSVSCQVYNNVPEDKRSREAVKKTRGMVLADRKGNVVKTYYYSTSWGHSASGKDVWNTKKEIPYLKAKFQATEKAKKKSGIKEIDLSDEEKFKKFIRKEPYETYDSRGALYRWNMTVSRDILSVRVESRLQECYAEDPSLVLTQTKNGKYRSKPLKPLGTIKRIRIEKRAKSGLVTEIVLVGRENVVKVCTQYNIRRVLGSPYESIYYSHDKKKLSMQLLPSAAFYVEEAVKDGEPAFCFFGGGYGHGAGMSQCGAERMAAMGKSYQEILAHYFADTKLLLLPEFSKA